MRIYRHRIADELLKRKLLGKGAVLVQGPKWCGKTTTAKQVAKSLLDLGDAAELSSAQETIHILPKKLLEGDPPGLSMNGKLFPSFGIWYAVK